jgi:YHS domain-containing protein
MNFFARIIRFLFWVMIFSWGFRLIGRWLSNWLRSDPRQEPAEPASDLHTPQAARLLVRDPVCGVHLAEVLAIPLRENGEVLHFCSPACRDTYLGSSRKLAANA